MKKLFKILLGFFLISLVLFLGALTYIFFKPEVIINPVTLRYALDKTSFVKNVSWTKGEFDIGWIEWNQRPFKGDFENLCLEYKSESADLETCFKKISWDLIIKFDFTQGFSVTSPGPIILHASKTHLVIKPSKDKKDSKLPDLKSYWDLFWGPIVPDFSLELLNTQVVTVAEKFDFNLVANKVKNDFSLSVLSYELKANPTSFTLTGPRKYDLPFSLFKDKPFDLRDLKLKGEIKNEGIDVLLTSAILSAGIKAQVFVPWPEDSMTSIRYQKKVLNTLEASIELSDVQEFYKGSVPLKYAVLPAPLNVMNGKISVSLRTVEAKGDNTVIKSEVLIDLKSLKQVIDVKLLFEVPVNLRSYEIGAVTLEIDFKKVTLQLPRISKKSLPPQFTPDSRIYHTPFGPTPPTKDEASDGKKIKLNLDLAALNQKALHLRTNLLDEALRLNFDLHVRDGELDSGFVQVLPLKTKVFKRPVHVQHFKMTFNHPQTPVIEGDILFPLPNYKISLHLEGPMDDPRYSFSSVPPLQKDDIYSVLLFGKTMADLGLDDQKSAQKTTQVLAQGIFSLAALYYLAGSSVQYVGYDPASGNGIAQVGVGKNSSLRVQGRDNYNSASIRRSIGKGWYIDTSSETSTLNPNGSRNYGVMLERIIAY